MTEYYFTQEALDKYDTAQRNESIEECARVAEEHDIGQGWGDAIAAAIRALKEKP